ncbi:hypothetical protein [Rouxiella badensis]|jgi:hypothetical protein|uniref:hypothetical protein n=1 Tax=Rouxiella badensis TaxID=1646377 RepID=UPI0022AB3D7B|nr:hypothetical protein [Rouxiella badensis]WAT10104.1 hypothetical protein O1V65_05955 [Rouxiella badensis]
MSKETGGTAFPLPNESETCAGYEGMTLRDYFAAKSMQATQSNPEWNHWSTEQHAEYAYGVADAMLAERGKP